MDLQSALALAPLLAALLIALAGTCFVFGGRRAGRWLLLARSPSLRSR